MLEAIRHGLRSLRSRKQFTAFAVIALGLGIGLNCAWFAVVNSLLLRPLPYRDVHEIVEISGVPSDRAFQELAGSRSLNGVAAFTPRGFRIATNEGSRNVYGLRVSANLFEMLGIEPMLGRIFTSADSDSPVVLLSYQYWQRTSGKPDIIGQSITIAEDQQRVIVGVLPADFTLQVRDANLFVPVRVANERVLARLHSGVSSGQAEAEIAAIVRNSEQSSTGPAARIRVTPIAEAFRPNNAGTAWLFQAAVAVVLLITCVNVANLLLVNGNARRREFAIRAALGGGRSRIFQQLMTENLIVGLAGGLLGLVLASWSLTFLNSVLPPSFTRMLRGADGLSIDFRVVMFSLAISIGTVLLFGLVPALSALRFDLISSLREARPSSAGRNRFGRILVAAEVGLALMLLVAAGLTVKSLLRLYNQDLGFIPDRILRTAIDLPLSRYPAAEQRQQALQEFLDRAGQLPGVESVSIIGPQLFPFGGPAVRGAFFRILDQPELEPRAEFYHATPEYFRALRIPLLKGRSFSGSDTAASPPVALVSDVVAKRYWPDGDAIGKRIQQDPRNPASPSPVIIGIVGNVRNPVGLDFTPIIYRPLPQTEVAGGTVMVRTTADPLSLAAAIRREILVADPNAVEFRARDLSSIVKDYVSPQRFATSLFGAFAAVGLLLAAIGIFAVTRHWVSTRIAEIGIRIALGADRQRVLAYVLRQAAISAAFGVGIGICAALALQGVMANQLYGVAPMDPQVFIAVSALVALVSIAAALFPAFRASRVDPVIALRQE